jgi:hypothetical protein
VHDGVENPLEQKELHLVLVSYSQFLKLTLVFDNLIHQCGFIAFRQSVLMLSTDFL